MIIDLDNNAVIMSEDEKLPSLPEIQVDMLLEYLHKHVFPGVDQVDSLATVVTLTPDEIERTKRMHEYKIRMSFVAFFVSLFYKIRRYINIELEDTDLFDVEEYVKNNVTTHHVSYIFYF
jgi:hypothetical protein